MDDPGFWVVRKRRMWRKFVLDYGNKIIHIDKSQIDVEHAIDLSNESCESESRWGQGYSMEA